MGNYNEKSKSAAIFKNMTDEINEQQSGIGSEKCPLCNQNSLILTERDVEVPHFGKVYLFSMTCDSCKYHKADVESVEQKEPVKFEFEISSEDDMKVRVIKSAEATVKLPHIATITPGPAAQGYITNVEGVINRVKYQIEASKEAEDDDSKKKKAKSLLKKINRITCGQENQKIIIEDPSGNSAIISDKAVRSSFKVKKF